MPSLYLDVTALRRCLWAAAMLSVCFHAWPSSATCRIANAAEVSRLPFVIPALVFEAFVLLLRVTRILTGPYVMLAPQPPFLQLPPIGYRLGIGWWRVTMNVFAIGALALIVDYFTCLPWPLLVAAVAIMLHALVLLVPCFGATRFWRLHYKFRLAMGAYEEWFCTAQIAARALLTVPGASDAHVCVVGSGVSELPSLLSTRCARVTAVDASHAAISAMRERTPRVEWLCADVTDLNGIVASSSIDLVCDKGTFAALLEHSPASCAAGFAEAHRVLRRDGRLLSIMLVPISASQLSAAGFHLEKTYCIPAINACACEPSRLVYAQVAVAVERPETGTSTMPAALDTLRFDGAGYEEYAAAVELPLLGACEGEDEV